MVCWLGCRKQISVLFGQFLILEGSLRPIADKKEEIKRFQNRFCKKEKIILGPRQMLSEYYYVMSDFFYPLNYSYFMHVTDETIVSVRDQF